MAFLFVQKTLERDVLPSLVILLRIMFPFIVSQTPVYPRMSTLCLPLARMIAQLTLETTPLGPLFGTLKSLLAN
jgi:hypothetical protein